MVSSPSNNELDKRRVQNDSPYKDFFDFETENDQGRILDVSAQKSSIDDPLHFLGLSAKKE